MLAANDDPTNLPPQQTTFPGSTPQNTAINNCAMFAEDQTDTYYQFQIYLNTHTDLWVCRAYPINVGGHQSSAAYFNRPNSYADPVFGYQYNYQ